MYSEALADVHLQDTGGSFGYPAVLNHDTRVTRLEPTAKIVLGCLWFVLFPSRTDSPFSWA